MLVQLVAISLGRVICGCNFRVLILISPFDQLCCLQSCGSIQSLSVNRLIGMLGTEKLERGLSNLLVQLRQLEPGVQKLAQVNNNLVEWNKVFGNLLTATSMQRSATQFSDFNPKEETMEIQSQIPQSPMADSTNIDPDTPQMPVEPVAQVT